MKTPLIMLTALALAVPGAASAAKAQEESIAIEYRDLNLSSPEGLERLEYRVEAAARKVCGLDESSLGSRIRNRDAQRCYDETKEMIDAQFAAVVERQAKGG
ncbi:UrcA family protein [Qipengyuania sp. GH38]|uniref:UrcA family protein n=1 Tax=Qipengyuania intermedia TaxID=2867244 RepID=UPI001C869B9E|nr:UrcA family protein [Qipengyuania intermedia]MBX7513969.1 UrcA family protein [Qipengyuania intermedia]